jgi:hypothetical protein
MSNDPQNQANQGEGNRQAARRYDEATREHIRSNDVEQEARDAAGQDAEEAARSEAEGRARAKEKDPEVARDYSKPSKD